MSGSVGGVRATALGRPEDAAGASPRADRDAALMAASRQLEGVFAHHLMKALRNTVPNGGHADAPGADLYGSLMDEHFSTILGQDTGSGIAEAIYRQLSSDSEGIPDGGSGS